MISNIIFAICVFVVMYYLPVIIIKGVRGHTILWPTLLPFAIGATGIVLFFCNIY